FDRAVRRYAAGILAPQRPLGQALAELVHRLHEDIAHVPGSISPATTLAEVLTRREGTSQDLAGLAVGCLRLAGLPARCVSGYLVGGHPQTPPPPGPAKPAGADAVHAWVSVCVPQWGWVDLDPTHDRPTDDRYVVTAWGRDHADMLPLRGVVFTDGTESTLTVGVDVVRL
ncbi:MAG TPA: transglutaminase family protein, partial [Kineosporiaceae bacterium]|nr:transglutaminase family protein [Kineosporiaceae bacterium]